MTKIEGNIFMKMMMMMMIMMMKMKMMMMKKNKPFFDQNVLPSQYALIPSSFSDMNHLVIRIRRKTGSRRNEEERRGRKKGK